MYGPDLTQGELGWLNNPEVLSFDKNPFSDLQVRGGAIVRFEFHKSSAVGSKATIEVRVASNRTAVETVCT